MRDFIKTNSALVKSSSELYKTAKTTLRLPTYNQLFGYANFAENQPNRSILSPAAYFVDLMRMVSDFIPDSSINGGTDNNIYLLKSRRPDLWTSELSSENTEQEVSKLSIAIEVMQNLLVKLTIKTDGADFKPLASLLAIRSALATNDTAITPIWQALNPSISVYGSFNQQDTEDSSFYAAQFEALGLSLAHWKSILDITVKPPEVPSTMSLEEVIKDTGLTAQQLDELINQDLPDSPDAEYIRSNFYINQGDRDKTSPLIIAYKKDDSDPKKTITLLDNLTSVRMARIKQFVALADVLDWRYANLDWALGAIAYASTGSKDNKVSKKPKFINNDILPYLIFLKKVSQALNGSVLAATGLIAPLDNQRTKSDKSFYEQTFATYLQLGLSDDYEWTPPNTDSKTPVSAIDSQVQSALAKDLYLSTKDLLAIASSLVVNNQLKLDAHNLSLLYRLSHLPKLTGFSIVSLTDKNAIATLSAHYNIIKTSGKTDSEAFNAIQELANLGSMVASSPFTADQLQLLLNGHSREVELNNRLLGADAKFNFEVKLTADLKSTGEIKDKLTDAQKSVIYQNLSSLFGVSEQYFYTAYPLEQIPEVPEQSGSSYDIGNLNSLVEAISKDLNKLQRYVLLIQGLSLSVTESNYFLTGVQPNNNDKSDMVPVTEIQLSLNQFLAIFQLKVFILHIKDSQNHLINYLSAADSIDYYSEALAKITGWNPGDLSLLSNQLHLSTGRDICSVANNLMLLQKYFTISKQLHIDILSLTEFNQLFSEKQVISAGNENLIKVEHALNSGLYQNHSDTEIEQHQGSKNQVIRDSLVRQLISKLNEKEGYRELGIANARHLYEYLLIDVEVEDVVKTSKIKEAIGAVQLYVYRCLNGLEPITLNEEQHSKLTQYWQWMDHYTTWQANREIFLYPEDYIQPQFRHDVTPPFAHLEQTLKQIDFNDSNAITKAFNQYMEGFNEVANLSIINCNAYQTETDLGTVRNLCFIGQTRKSPESYYSMEASFLLDDSGFQPIHWQPWQTINLSIHPSCGIHPVFAFGKWYIFWVNKVQSGHSVSNEGVNPTSPTFKAQILHSNQTTQKEWGAVEQLTETNYTNEEDSLLVQIAPLIDKIKVTYGSIIPVSFYLSATHNSLPLIDNFSYAKGVDENKKAALTKENQTYFIDVLPMGLLPVDATRVGGISFEFKPLAKLQGKITLLAGNKDNSEKEPDSNIVSIDEKGAISLLDKNINKTLDTKKWNEIYVDFNNPLASIKVPAVLQPNSSNFHLYTFTSIESENGISKFVMIGPKIGSSTESKMQQPQLYLYEVEDGVVSTGHPLFYHSTKRGVPDPVPARGGVALNSICAFVPGSKNSNESKSGLYLGYTQYSQSKKESNFATAKLHLDNFQLVQRNSFDDLTVTPDSAHNFIQVADGKDNADISTGYIINRRIGGSHSEIYFLADAKDGSYKNWKLPIKNIDKSVLFAPSSAIKLCENKNRTLFAWIAENNNKKSLKIAFLDPILRTKDRTFSKWELNSIFDTSVLNNKALEDISSGANFIRNGNSLFLYWLQSKIQCRAEVITTHENNDDAIRLKNIEILTENPSCQRFIPINLFNSHIDSETSSASNLLAWQSKATNVTIQNTLKPQTCSLYVNGVKVYDSNTNMGNFEQLFIGQQSQSASPSSNIEMNSILALPGSTFNENRTFNTLINNIRDNGDFSIMEITESQFSWKAKNITKSLKVPALIDWQIVKNGEAEYLNYPCNDPGTSYLTNDGFNVCDFFYLDKDSNSHELTAISVASSQNHSDSTPTQCVYLHHILDGILSEPIPINDSTQKLEILYGSTPLAILHHGTNYIAFNKIDKGYVSTHVKPYYQSKVFLARLIIDGEKAKIETLLSEGNNSIRVDNESQIPKNYLSICVFNEEPGVLYTGINKDNGNLIYFNFSNQNNGTLNIKKHVVSSAISTGNDLSDVNNERLVLCWLDNSSDDVVTTMAIARQGAPSWLSLEEESITKFDLSELTNLSAPPVFINTNEGLFCFWLKAQNQYFSAVSTSNDKITLTGIKTTNQMVFGDKMFATQSFANSDDKSNKIASVIWPSGNEIFTAKTFQGNQGPAGFNTKQQYSRLIRMNSTALSDVISQLHQFDIATSLTTENQLRKEIPFENLAVDTSETIISPPSDNIDFFNTAVSQYYREAFFHVPFLIANALKNNMFFSQARTWYNYIFNPSALKHPSGEYPNDRFWQYVGLKEQYNTLLRSELSRSIAEDTQTDLGAQTPNSAKQLAQYHYNPFDPGAIADLRPEAYQKTILMHYVDNLLSWGDQLFIQNTRESIIKAELLYVMAFDLLGEDDRTTIAPALPEVTNFDGLLKDEDALKPSELHEFLIKTKPSGGVSPVVTPSNYIPNVYFGIPENARLNSYWETLEKRLYNIRHNLDINGRKEHLPLFQPSIDPETLVKQVASGDSQANVIDISSDVIPKYRFNVVIQKAKELTQSVIQLGNSLMSALEKKDAASLMLLNSVNQQHILTLTVDTKKQAINQLDATVSALESGLASAQQRRNYYSGLVANGWLPGETAQVELERANIELQLAARLTRPGLAVAYGLPNIFGLADGGMNFGKVAEEATQTLFDLASTYTSSAGLSGTVAGFQRRSEEWQNQLVLSENEVIQAENQLNSAKYQLEMAKQELSTLQVNIAQEQKVERYLKNKFTDEQLYSWMVGQLSNLYAMTYQLAHETALQAQNAWHFEKASDNNPSSFIHIPQWNGLHQGLMAGETLLMGLQRMEMAYMSDNERRLEVVKTIPLSSLPAPSTDNAEQTVLECLNQSLTGSCTFSIDEGVFNNSFIHRQIKSISVSIPAVLGPYENIHGILKQTSNTLSAGNEKITDFRANQQIALSSGMNDTGLFQLNFDDPRYLPFEGNGAISNWELKINPADNPSICKPDGKTLALSEVIIELRYTAIAYSLSINIEQLPVAEDGKPYDSAKLSATGGATPYKWSYQKDKLEDIGLHINEKGEFSGTAINKTDKPIERNVKVTVTDQKNKSESATFTIKVNPALKILNPNIPSNIIADKSTSIQMIAVGGYDNDYSWRSENLQDVPGDLSIDPKLGLISGTPTKQGTYNVNITVTDGAKETATKEITFVVNPALTIDKNTLSFTAYINEEVNHQLTASGGEGEKIWSSDSITVLKEYHLELSKSGMVTGKPTKSCDQVKIDVTVTDHLGTSDSNVLTVNIPPPLTIITHSAVAAVDSDAYIPLQADNGKPPLVWDVKSKLPPNLQFDKDHQAIVGKADKTTLGQHEIDVQVTDAGGQTATGKVELKVNPGFHEVEKPVDQKIWVGRPLEDDGIEVWRLMGGVPGYYLNITGELPEGLRLRLNTVQSTGEDEVSIRLFGKAPHASYIPSKVDMTVKDKNGTSVTGLLEINVRYPLE